jgi:hypothetical protein
VDSHHLTISLLSRSLSQHPPTHTVYCAFSRPRSPPAITVPFCYITDACTCLKPPLSPTVSDYETDSGAEMFAGKYADNEVG